MNNLVDEYNNTYHHPVCKKSIDTLTKEIETNLKAPELKVGDRVKITKYKNIFRNYHTKNLSQEIFVIDSVFKANPWTYKIKDLNGEKTISFYEK